MKGPKTVLSELETVIPSLFIQDMGARVDAPPAAAAHSLSLVGEVLNSSSPDFPGRVLVRWRALDGALNEGWLSVVRGLALERRETVLLHRPSNWPAWLVTHAIKGETDSHLSHEPGYPRSD